jgi:hypothetical protein
MGGLVLLDDYRKGLTVKSIAGRLVRLGHDATAVSKLLASLMRGKNLSMVELCAVALRRLEHSRTQAEARKLCKPRKRMESGTERAPFVRTLRLVVRSKP